MAEKLPPVPYQAPMANDTGIVTPAWGDWFKQLFTRVGGHLGSTDDFVASKAASGYQRLPSGLVLQWGVTGSLASGATTETTFPRAFESSCLQVVVGLRDMSGASTSDTGHYGTGGYTTTKFDLYNRTASAYTFNWFAIGH